MVVWHDMAAHPPGRELIGELLLFTVQPRYGEPYTDAYRWYGPSNRVWPKVTHWALKPAPAPQRKEGNHGKL